MKDEGTGDDGTGDERAPERLAGPRVTGGVAAVLVAGGAALVVAAVLGAGRSAEYLAGIVLVTVGAGLAVAQWRRVRRSRPTLLGVLAALAVVASVAWVVPGLALPDDAEVLPNAVSAGGVAQVISVDGDRTVVQSATGQVLVYVDHDAAGGLRVGSDGLAGLDLSSRTLYTTSDGGLLTAYDVDASRLLWQRDLVRDDAAEIVYPLAAPAAGGVIVAKRDRGAGDRSATVIRIDDGGEIRWRLEVTDREFVVPGSFGELGRLPSVATLASNGPDGGLADLATITPDGTIVEIPSAAAGGTSGVSESYSYTLSPEGTGCVLQTYDSAGERARSTRFACSSGDLAARTQVVDGWLTVVGDRETAAIELESGVTESVDGGAESWPALRNGVRRDDGSVAFFGSDWVFDRAGWEPVAGAGASFVVRRPVESTNPRRQGGPGEFDLAVFDTATGQECGSVRVRAATWDVEATPLHGCRMLLSSQELWGDGVLITGRGMGS